MAETLTINQMANTIGQSEATIRKWLPKASAIIPCIGEKLVKAKKTRRAVRFYLENILAIIRAGGDQSIVDRVFEYLHSWGKHNDYRLPHPAQFLYRTISLVTRAVSDQLSLVYLFPSPLSERTVEDRWLLRLISKMESQSYDRAIMFIEEERA